MSRRSAPRELRQGFGRRLKAAMASGGVTRTQLAKGLHIGTSKPGTWIDGDGLPEPNTIRALAVRLNVSTDYLLNVPGSSITGGGTPPASALGDAVRAHVIEYLLGTDAGAGDRRRVERSVPSGRELLARLGSIAEAEGAQWEEQRRAEVRDSWVKRTLRTLLRRAANGDGGAALAMAYLTAAHTGASAGGSSAVVLNVPWVHHAEVCLAILGPDAAKEFRATGTPDEGSWSIPLSWEKELPENERETVDILAGRLPKLVIRHLRPGALRESE